MILNYERSPQTEDSILMAEAFLVQYLKPSKDKGTFDYLRFAAFSSNVLKLNFEKTPSVLQ